MKMQTYVKIFTKSENFYTTSNIPFRKKLNLKTNSFVFIYDPRYLNPRNSMWLSADPAMAEYIPGAPLNDEARKRNGNLPGMGGIFNVINLHVYHYAGNNPIKLVDPNGRTGEDIINIEPQIPDDPEDYHCDIMAWNNALDNNFDPRSQSGENWDGNELDIPEILDLFPENRNNIPPPNTSGYAFTPRENPNHMIFYERGSGDTYTAHQSDGIEPTTPREWSIHGNFPRDAIFVPLPRLRRD